jgi:ribonuclease HII
MEPDLCEEMALCNQGYRLIAGLDEAGRGSWAGPVVAGAVILPLDMPDLVGQLEGVRDSKELTPRQRDRLLERIRATALAMGVGVASPTLIDVLGIVPATRLAMGAALRELPLPPDALLIDALPLPDCTLPQRWLIHGDRLCLSIAAASIVAKVTRDRLMVDLEVTHPGYGFARHKGYGTPQHRQALANLGPSSLHRFSFAPIRRRLEGHA